MATARTLDAARVLVLGAARSGTAAAAAIRRTHPGIAVRLVEGDERGLLGDADLLIKSPGVPGTAPVVLAARERGIPVWSEVELAYRLMASNPWIGITGTNGKSTVTSLIGAMLAAAGIDARIAGNIGDAASGYAGALDPSIWVVCELSSFQLEDVDELHPRIAVLLNVTPDHIDRHGSLEAYAAAKLRIFARQGADDVAVLDDDDPWIAATPDAAIPGAARKVRVRRDEAPADLRAAFTDSALGGSHNLENVLAASAAAEAAGAARVAVLDAIRAFRPLAHRMERVGEIGGVVYVNDSKATNEEAAIRALDAFTHGVHLILGGSLKGGGDFAPLASAVAHGPVEASYLIGEAAELLDRALARAGARRTRHATLADALEAAAAAAVAGDTVLLAPACASFDQFRDFEDRGDTFRALVEELAA